MNDAAEVVQIAEIMDGLGRAARAAQTDLARTDAEQRRQALTAAAAGLRQKSAEILAENRKDMQAAEARGLSSAMLDRLLLDDDRVEAMAAGLEAIAALPDPVGRVIAEWERPNGLRIQRVSVPLGVIGIIYESRPKRDGRRGGTLPEVWQRRHSAWRLGEFSFEPGHPSVPDRGPDRGRRQSGRRTDDTDDRSGAVGYLLSSMADTVDVIVPRGGKRLIQRVQDEARVPVIGHLEGICHVYLHESADADMAEEIVLNAKLRRTGICGAAETLLVDKAAASALLPRIVDALDAEGCTVRGDEAAQALSSKVQAASEEDWSTEYLDSIIACRIVDDLDAAVEHITRYGSGHTESIVAEDAGAAERFLGSVDSAIVMHNASTQFADGGEFGMGAEIGIATGRIHARGPVGAEQLTSFKYVVLGTGQVRP